LCHSYLLLSNFIVLGGQANYFDSAVKADARRVSHNLLGVKQNLFVQ
jgi:hypothetical protein